MQRMSMTACCNFLVYDLLGFLPLLLPLLHLKLNFLCSDRNHRKRKHLEGHTDYSGRMSDEIEDQVRDKRQTSPETKMRIDVQV